MWLLSFLQGFVDLFRSRYVRYLEGEVKRLRLEVAGLNSTLMGTMGIHQVASPDLQDLSARGQQLRREVEPRGKMKPVVKRSTISGWTRELERRSAKEAASFEKEIKENKEARERIDAPQSSTG
jgi:hypothetical protein